MTAVTSISRKHGSPPAGMADEEWDARCELAAAYRLAALYGWTDLNNTHFSLRVPGTANHFLINPFGMFFDEITASSLIVIDNEGNVLGDSDYPVNPAGFIIHGAIHMSAPGPALRDPYPQPLRRGAGDAKTRPAAGQPEGADGDGLGRLSRFRGPGGRPGRAAAHRARSGRKANFDIA